IRRQRRHVQQTDRKIAAATFRTDQHLAVAAEQDGVARLVNEVVLHGWLVFTHALQSVFPANYFPTSIQNASAAVSSPASIHRLSARLPAYTGSSALSACKLSPWMMRLSSSAGFCPLAGSDFL